MINETFKAEIWETEVEIPTYPAGEPDKNPLFVEKRVYQGSSGKVYPLPFVDKIYDEKVNKKYTMVILENPYIRIEILPELGGRIQRALDKTNNYDFVYYNRVIKPALVGLAGPWISGGIEFNWPQHHRPSTYSPVEYYLEENADGSKTCWVSEIDKMYGTKGMAGFTLYPDKAYLEIKGQLYNRTSLPQTFLWWANPAVVVNDHTKSIFPPDVHAVFDHGKRDVSKFPIATGVYYKMDYSSGVDISRYKNIPVPTSYMAYHSDYDFVGGYDFSKEAGILHVADHHISPGKKQWTWGCGDFGKAWDRNLTDEDGPYIELMTGVYTDNQPDFSWLQPYEEKSFKQYFMPYKNAGEVKNANIDIVLNMVFKEDTAEITLYTTSVFKGLKLKLTDETRVCHEEIIDCISPEKAITRILPIDTAVEPSLYLLAVYKENGDMLISYREKKEEILQTPGAAEPAPAPEEIGSNEALYLTGIHLEQYRHATYEPDAYYLEALKRDPSDIRNNNAYGLLLFRRGYFEESEKYFRRAVAAITVRNPNPYDGEPYYNLGLSLKMQEKYDEAYAAFRKAAWNSAWQDSGYFEAARIACRRKDYSMALELIDKSIVRNSHNTKARGLKSILLRKLGRADISEKYLLETIEIDKIDFMARDELAYIYQNKHDLDNYNRYKNEFISLLRGDPHNYIEVAADYAAAGFYEEAVELLSGLLDMDNPSEVYPMVYYYIGYYHGKLNSIEKSAYFYGLGMEAKPDYCFPNKLESILVLQDVIQVQGKDARACYYLANLLYDKKQYEKAISLWEKSRTLDPDFPTVHRNLGLAYYNKAKDVRQAVSSMEKAFELNKTDARVLFELDQLYKKTNAGHGARLAFLTDHFTTAALRDDLYLEYVTLYNNLGQYEKAQELVANRIFHPWEGGEGKVTAQYKFYTMGMAKKHMGNKEYSMAIACLEAAKVFPDNLGEGKLYGSSENDIDYYLGCAYLCLNRLTEAEACFEAAATGIDVPSDMMFYNDQPADRIFYQGLALLKLGRTDAAKSKFNKLYDYGEKHLFDRVRIDYFAVSLPDFLVFDEDLNRKNQVHCRYLMGLGLMGLGKIQAAKEQLQTALEANIHHQGVLVHLTMCHERLS